MRKTPDKSRTALAVGLALVVVTLGVFSQVRTFDFIIYDDPTYVIANEQVKAGLTAKGVAWAFTTSRASNWHPLSWLSLMLDCSVFGPDPHRLHLTNLLLHTANSVLLLTVLVKMTRALWRSAFGAALLRKDKTDQAIVHFEKALQLDPCDVITHLDLGAAFAKQGKQQQAIEHFTQALRIDPCCTDAFNLREQLLRQRQPDPNSMSPKGNN